jgi:hypothetical protein
MNVCNGLPVLRRNREKTLYQIHEIVEFLRSKLKSTAARGRNRSHEHEKTTK